MKKNRFWTTGRAGVCLVFVFAMSAAAGERTVRVNDVNGLRQALANAAAGTRVLIAPGQYRGGLHFRNLRGRPKAPIVVAAADPKSPPVIKGGGTCLQLSDVAHIELHNLVLRGAKGNGLNIDDSGSYETPSHHILLRGLKVSDIGPKGNRDGIKLSGVDDFRLEQCTVERWGSGGQGIDMVGCHRGVIEACRLRFEDDKGSGVQAKGGSRDIVIRRCRFEHAGARAINVGGSTGLKFFRPPLENGEAHYEAKDITVEGCTFVGSMAPVAFVGVDGATFRFNTIYRPRKWVMRILQETRAKDFVPSRKGAFTDNIIVFQSAEVSTTVNIGSATAPDTFRFARNWWYCLDRPARSRPSLPRSESNATVGRDPLLRNPEQGDVSTKKDSPARDVGAGALPHRHRRRSAK